MRLSQRSEGQVQSSPARRYPKDFEMAQALQQQWEEGGIDVTWDTMNGAA